MLCPTAGTATPTPGLTTMTLDITNTVSKFFVAVDRCDWEAVQALMTAPFHVDYFSYSGDDPAEVTPADLTGAWAGFMPYFDSVHHQIGNLIVDQNGDSADVQCHGMATHFIADQPGGDIQFIVGTYDLKLTKSDGAWKLSAMRFNFKYASGNADLVAEAGRRAAKHPKGKSDV